MRRAVKMLGGQEDIKPRPPRSIRGTFDQDLAEIMDAINDVNPPPPPPSFFPDAANAAASFGALFAGNVTIDDIADAVTAAGGSFEDWMDEWTGYMGESIQYSLETAVQLLKVTRGIVQMSANMTAYPLLVALYGIQCALYEAIKKCKRLIALNGLTYPDVDSIDDNLSKSLMFIFDEECHYIHAEKPRRNFPTLRAKGQVHLIAPLYADECRMTTPAFHTPGYREMTPADFAPDEPYHENLAVLEPVTPRSFIQDEPFNVDALKSYAGAATPQEHARLKNLPLATRLNLAPGLLSTRTTPISSRMSKRLSSPTGTWTVTAATAQNRGQDWCQTTGIAASMKSCALRWRQITSNRPTSSTLQTRLPVTPFSIRRVAL